MHKVKVTDYYSTPHCSRAHQAIRKHTRPLRGNGLTLLELLLVVSLIAILSSIAVPGLSHLLRANETRIAVNNVLQNIQYARNTALIQHTAVTLCASLDKINCSGYDWSTGGLIFRDKDANGKRDSDDETLKVIEPLKENQQLLWRSFRSKPYLTFTAEGVTYYQNGNFTYCPENKDPKYAAQVIISYTGRPRYARDTDMDGIVNSTSGKNVKCE